MQQQHTISVSDTNQQALASKISAIRRGYFIDPFAQQFSPFKGNRDIIMHRGYWARVYLVRKLVQKFLNNCQDRNIQIISLGCGLQTLWFNLMMDEKYSKKNLTFVELDLNNVIKKKVRKIQKSKMINGLVQKLGLWQNRTVAEDNSFLSYGNNYILSPCDLQDVSGFKELMGKLSLDSSKPTFFYCQCVLSYVQPDSVDSILNWIFDYEMFNPDDRFGKMMVQNFQSRGCPLVGIHKYPKLQDQFKRFQNAGFQQGNIELNSMKNIYYDYIDKNQRQKIQKLQMLDEFQQWNMMMAHYFGLLAFNCKKIVQDEVQKSIINAMHMKQ